MMHHAGVRTHTTCSRTSTPRRRYGMFLVTHRCDMNETRDSSSFEAVRDVVSICLWLVCHVLAPNRTCVASSIGHIIWFSEKWLCWSASSLCSEAQSRKIHTTTWADEEWGLSAFMIRAWITPILFDLVWRCTRYMTYCVVLGGSARFMNILKFPSTCYTHCGVLIMCTYYAPEWSWAKAAVTHLDHDCSSCFNLSGCCMRNHVCTLQYLCLITNY